MGKISKKISLKNACIDSKKMIITEINKDDTQEFSLTKILEEWNGIEGVSFSISHDSDLSSSEVDYSDEGDEED